jgi:hypothetical protein
MQGEFENIFNEKMKQLDVSPPSDVWDNISDELDLQDVWQNISNELDIQEVWQNIDSKLTSISRIQTFVKVSSLTALLLLLVVSSYFFLKLSNSPINRLVSDYPFVKIGHPQLADNAVINQVTKVDTKSKVKEKLVASRKGKKDNTRLKTKKVAKKESKKNNKALKQKRTEGSNTALSKKTINRVNINNRRATKPSNDNVPLIAFGTNTHPIAILHPVNLFSLLTQSNDRESNNESLNQLLFGHPAKDAGYTPEYVDNTKYIIIGSSFTYSNTWILNSSTSISYEKNSLNQTNISFGYAYSALIGYTLSNKLTLQSECLINNKQEQSYIEYREGKRVYENIEMNYTQVNLLAKKTNAAVLFNKIPTSFNYIGGLQYGYMKSISETTNGITNSVADDYKKNNYSLILGLEYQVILNKSFALFAGLRADIGLNNLYSGDSNSINKTYNTSLGLNVGLSYRIPYKKKGK